MMTTKSRKVLRAEVLEQFENILAGAYLRHVVIELARANKQRRVNRFVGELDRLLGIALHRLRWSRAIREAKVDCRACLALALHRVGLRRNQIEEQGRRLYVGTFRKVHRKPAGDLLLSFRALVARTNRGCADFIRWEDEWRPSSGSEADVLDPVAP